MRAPDTGCVRLEQAAGTAHEQCHERAASRTSSVDTKRVRTNTEEHNAMVERAKGIIDPPIDELLSKVDSKYALVIFASKRARQINDYYADLHEGSLFDNVGPLVDSTIDDKPLFEFDLLNFIYKKDGKNLYPDRITSALGMGN